MADAAPVVLAGLSGGAIAVALVELARSVPFLAAYLSSAHLALLRVGAEGRLPTAAERQRLVVVACSVLGALGLAAFGPGFAGAAVVCGPAGAGWLVGRRQAGYRRRVEKEIPAIALALADSLAAGGTLRNSLIAAGAAVDGPAASELTRVRADLALGLAPRESLAAFQARLGSERLGELTAALSAHQLTGGELATLLRRHAAAAESRTRAARRAETATAQARVTGAMVVAMPVAAILLVELAVPGFARSMLADPAAAALIAAAFGLQILGYLAIQRLGRAPR